MSTISDITLLIGTIATSAGTIFGIGLSIYTLTRKEAQNFRLSVKEHQALVNPAPGYSDEKKYTNLRVVNIGGRPLRISSAGYAFLNYDSGGIFADSVRNSSVVVDIDNVHDYLGDETDKPDKKISYYYATSLTGKTRKIYMTPRLIVWMRDLLSKSKVWKKPALHERRATKKK
ncbi:MAG TPA: hypothetical protein VFT53_04340 [Candidatus Saccharimonadales bacterium]|nr:hypothetical protein [Candidatus Saccharimonadales bacterium]